MQNNIYELLQNTVQDSDLKPSELPTLDLYMDQIITLMAEKLGENSDRLLTKTMINNYSKEGLIKPVKGKKYSKEHITQMLLIYQLKGVLSIGEIKTLLEIIKDVENPDEAIINLVEEFLHAKDYQRKVLPSQIEVMLEETGCDTQTKEGRFKAVMALCSASQYLKSMAQAILSAENTAN